MGDVSAALLTQVGVMNRISTGHFALDMLLCLLVPVLLQQAGPRLQAAWDGLKKRLFGGPGNFCTRTIEHVQRHSWYYGDSEDKANNILQQAILLYLGSQAALTGSFSVANVDLVQGRKACKASSSCDGGSGGSVEDGDSDDDEVWDTTRQLETYRVNVVPPQATWVQVEPGVEFLREENALGGEGEGGGSSKATLVRFTLRSAAPDGRARVDAFVEKAYAYYRAQMTARASTARYLYTPIGGGGGGGGDGDSKQSGMLYKRYELSDEKTFDSLFHPDKAALLRLVDHFLQKTGKYAVAGHPHRLGLLLHGPPGTGKTSLIKALAHYTGRNIVSVPLAKISTNQELMDIVFDHAFRIQSEQLPVRLPFAKTIFVMEDVDAACSFVRRRAPAARPAPTTTMRVEVVEQRNAAGALDLVRRTSTVVQQSGAGGVQVPASPFASSADRTSPVEISDAATSTAHDPPAGSSPADSASSPACASCTQDPCCGTAGAAHPPAASAGEAAPPLQPAASRQPTLPVAVSGALQGPLLPDGAMEVAEGGLKAKLKGLGDHSDKLNLAGLLNVIDGVVDCPKRIIVMTTNHPEKLDPALIRPGRINKRIYMGHLAPAQAREMVAHYFGLLGECEAAAFASVFERCGAVTPAELEMLCADHDDLEGLIASLQRGGLQKTC